MLLAQLWGGVKKLRKKKNFLKEARGVGLLGRKQTCKAKNFQTKRGGGGRTLEKKALLGR